MTLIPALNSTQVSTLETHRAVFNSLFENGTGVIPKRMIIDKSEIVVNEEFLAYGESVGMTVKVKAGIAMVDGVLFYQDSTETLSVSNADATNPRIDAVVLDFDFTGDDGCEVELKLIEGTPAASPVEPTLTLTSTNYQLILGYVYVAAGATLITAANVVDYRVFCTNKRTLSMEILGDAGEHDGIPITEGMYITRVTLMFSATETCDVDLYVGDTDDFPLADNTTAIIEMSPAAVDNYEFERDVAAHFSGTVNLLDSTFIVNPNQWLGLVLTDATQVSDSVTVSIEYYSLGTEDDIWEDC